MTAQSERVRDREEDWRRERETEKMRDKQRYKDSDPREKVYEKDRAPVPRPRERDRDREWRERERRQEDDRRGRGRPLSNLEKESEREMERGMKKGDTFPRMRKISPDGGRKMTSTTEMRERGERRQKEKPKRLVVDEWDRDRERDWQRERHRERERDEMRSRAKEEGRRPVEEEKSRKRERYQESDQDRRRGDPVDKREMDTVRKREKTRPNMGERETRMPSPSRRRDGGIYFDRDMREGKRDTRSEGDSDERELRRERVRDREREELTYQQSRSEGDNKSRTERERYREEDRHRDKEADQARRRRAEKDRERYREADRERERWKDDKYREYDQRRRRETKEREGDPTTGKRSRAQNETAPKVPPRSQSSGEWSSDMDSDVMRQRRGRDSYEERESERGAEEQRNSERSQQRSERGETTEQRRMWLEPQRGKNSKGEFVDRERHSREEDRKMESQAEWEKGQRSYSGRHGGRDEDSRDRERESVGVNVDGEEACEVWREPDKRGEGHLSDSDGGIEGNRWRDAEGESVTDNTEESDREEEGGSDYWARSGSEERGSETEWKSDRDRMLSGEDGFVTLSSGGDEEDDREEEKFEDCQEFWEGEGSHDGHSPAFGEEEIDDEEGEGREKQPKYVFCVIGQTLPRSKTKDMSPSRDDQKKEMEENNPNSNSSHHGSDDVTQQPQSDLARRDINNQDVETSEVDIRYRELQSSETREGTKGKEENPYEEIGTIKRDSQTERLLMEWREKTKGLERESENNSPLPSNPYADVFSQVDLEQIQPILDGIKSGVMSPEEVEAIRIRMSGAWSMSEEPKRHSQAPHLKWAKNVVREILGRSEEKALEEPHTNIQEEEEEAGDMAAVRSDQEQSEPEPEEEEEEEEVELLEVEGLRGMGQNKADMHADQSSAMHGDKSTHTHSDTQLDAERKTDRGTHKQTEEKANVEAKISAEVCDEGRNSEMEAVAIREKKEEEIYLSVSSTLYKPSSCPILNYDTESEHLSSRESKEVEKGTGESEGIEPEEGVTEDEVGETREGEVGTDGKTNGGTLTSSCSFRDLGPEARIRRRGIRKTTERRKGELVEVEEEEEGVGRDRRPRIFSITGKKRQWRGKTICLIQFDPASLSLILL